MRIYRSKTSRSKSKSTPFVLSAEQLRAIDNEIEDNGNRASITAKCNDSARREFDSIDELLEYENTDDNRINELDFSCFSSHDATQDDQKGYNFLISWSSEPENPRTIFSDGCSTYASFSGYNKQVILDAEKKFWAQSRPTKPWYSCFARLDHTSLFFVFFLLSEMALILMIPEWVKKSLLEPVGGSPPNFFIEVIASTFIVGGILVMCGFPAFYLS